MTTPKNLIFKALTGGAKPVDESSDLRSKLLALAGRSDKTKSGVNLKAAAEKLGCSPQTVRRWLKTENTQAPSKKHQGAIDQATKQARTTKEGRATAISAVSRRGKKPPTMFAIDALQGPGEGPSYARPRIVKDKLTPEQWDSLVAAYEEGGEEAFMQRFEDIISTNYVNNWQIDRSTIQSLRFFS